MNLQGFAKAQTSTTLAKGEVQASWNFFDSKEKALEFVGRVVNGGHYFVSVIPVPMPKDWAKTVRTDKDSKAKVETGGLHILGKVDNLRIPMEGDFDIEAAPGRGNFYIGFKPIAKDAAA